MLLVCALTFLAVVQIWAWHGRQKNLTSHWHGEPVARMAYQEGQHGEILLPAQADGVEVGPCFLDSGAEAMVITPAAARRANLAKSVLHPWTILHGAMGGSSGFVPNRTAGEFRVGPIGIQRATIAELPELHEHITKATGEPFGSTCSAAIFHAAVVDIDWRARQVSFYRPGDTPANLKGLNWIPLIEIRNRPYLQIRFDHGHEGLFLIDTGMNLGVHFHRHAVEEFELLAGRITQPAEAQGIGGSGTVRARYMDRLQIGEHSIERVVATFDTEHRHRKNRRLTGMIGRDLLRRFRTIIDLPNRRAAFVAYEESEQG